MLVILNGAPKAGSTWLVLIIRAMKLFDKIPTEYQVKTWSNSSISDDLVERFVKTVNYQKQNYYCKQHWINSNKIRDLKLLSNPNIKMVNIIRDIRDVLVSRYFHELRLNLTKVENIDDYYWERGKNLMKGYINYHNSWHTDEVYLQPFLCSYEKFHSNFIEQLQDLVNYLEINSLISLEDMQKIERITSLDDKKNKGEGKFFRKGIVGDWKNYLSDSIVKDLEKTAIEAGYLETKKNMMKRYNLSILKEIDFGIQN